MTQKNLEWMFSGYVTLIPILQYYRSPLAAFNLATFLAMLFLLLFGFICLTKKGFYQENLKFPIYLYCAFIVFNLVFSTMKYDYEFSWSNLSPYFRFFVLFLSLLFVGRRFFDIKKAMKFLEGVLFVSSLIIVLQTVLSVFGVSFKAVIKPLLTDMNYGVSSGIRASGIYMEPSHFAQSAALYLAYMIFNGETTKRTRTVSVKFLAIIAGVVLSGSGQGYLFLAVLFILWILRNTFSKGFNSKKLIKLLFVCIIVVVAIGMSMQIPVVNYALSRVVDDDGGLGGVALGGRTYTNKLFLTLSSTQKFWGMGFGQLDSLLNEGYFNSLYTHLIECGYLSLFVLALMFIYIFKKQQLWVKYFLVIYAIMFYFTSCGNPMLMCFYLLFLLHRKQIKEVC